MKSLSRIQLLVTPRTVTYQAPQSLGFSRQGYWSGLPFPSSWAPKNRCFWNVVLEKTLESPLDCKEIKPVNPKGNPSWIFIGRADAEAETPILWPPAVKSWLIWKDPGAGKDWRQEEKGMTQHEMVWMASPTWWTWVWASSGSWWWMETWCTAVHGVAKSQTWLSDWADGGHRKKRQTQSLFLLHTGKIWLSCALILSSYLLYFLCFNIKLLFVRFL